MCSAPNRPTLFRHLNFQKRARSWGAVNVLTPKCALRHSGVQFLPRWLRKPPLLRAYFSTLRSSKTLEKQASTRIKRDCHWVDDKLPPNHGKECQLPYHQPRRWPLYGCVCESIRTVQWLANATKRKNKRLVEAFRNLLPFLALRSSFFFSSLLWLFRTMLLLNFLRSWFSPSNGHNLVPIPIFQTGPPG